MLLFFARVDGLTDQSMRLVLRRERTPRFPVLGQYSDHFTLLKLLE